ncbi:MAG TPA: T9SS type A sorting domain-containing protein [Saprospiraceae bacterium]|nr:T9SS type A sorting domain-containing protein [Saprospiraceae bacterium]
MSNPFLQCLLILASGLLPLQTTQAQNILLFEDFESGNFAAKGWYDGFPDQRTDTEFKNGRYSYAGRFAKGARTSGAGRHLFKPTDRVYISYWVKYSANYIGSGVGYHPHEWNILTDRDGIYQGPADAFLSAYIEQNAGKPILALQDSKNVDPNCILLNNNNFVGCNGNFKTYAFTENRSVCSCNGLIGELDRRDCYPNAGSAKGYYSSRGWHADTVYFRNSPGPYYKNDWHFVEAYFELNTIEQGKGLANGKIRYWYDGQLLIASDSILMRTAAHPDMKFNQLLYGPYIGVGSPVDQSWWIDDLTIADGRPVTATTRIKEQGSSFSLYPNPNDGTFTLQLNEPKSNPEDILFEILDALGKVLYRETIHSHMTSLSHRLPAGMYICRLNGMEGISRPSKLVIR